MDDLPAAKKRRAPAADRNVEPIISVLAEWLPAAGTVLEIASGTGQHAAAFARRFPDLIWQPSDTDPLALQSIEAWRAGEGLANLLEPIRLDASASEWPIREADAVLSINMVHIAPWNCALGLIAGAGQALSSGGSLILYGPWLKDDVETAPGNIAFDSELRQRNPLWGLRRVEDFTAAASSRGFDLVETRSMPTNNMMLHLRRNGSKSKD